MAVAQARSIAGVVGAVQWAYYQAATIQGYTVTRTGAAWSLRATVVAADAFKLSQRPLVFVATHQRGQWRWPIETLDVRGGQLTARLGPPFP